MIVGHGRHLLKRFVVEIKLGACIAVLQRDGEARLLAAASECGAGRLEERQVVDECVDASPSAVDLDLDPRMGNV
jgi:hypothetical protein